MEFTPEQLIVCTKKKLVWVGEDIQKIDDLGKTVLQDPSALPSFLVRESSVDKLYAAAVAHWERLLELSVLVGDKEKEVPSETDKNNYAALQKWYYRIKEVAMKHNSPSGRPSFLMSGTMNATTSSLRVRLPKITLPEFSGHFADWPVFRDTYLSLIHNEPSLSDIDKFHYLVSRLKGPALDTVKSITITEENYDQAWKALTRTFDSKRRLASSYLQKLLSFTPMKGRPTLASLSSFLTHVAESVSAFKTLKVTDPSEFILFELAIRGLDSTTREAFELAHTSTEFPKFSELVTFVEQRCLALSMLVDQAGAPTTPQSTPAAKGKVLTPVSLFTNQSGETEPNAEAPPTPSMSCRICSKSHRLKDCESFNKLTPDERYVALKSWRGCYNCLAPGHQSRQCRSPFCCQICRRRHHTLLHLDANKNSSSDSVQQNSSPPPPPTATPTQPSGSALTGLASHAPQVLLGTARAFILNSLGQPVRIRLVLDSGSQFSFITEDCVKRLGLLPTPFKQTILGIGQSTLKGAMGRATCHLTSSKVPQSPISTNAIVVSTIAPLLPQVEVPADLRNSFTNSDLQLADPEFWCPSDVDFLLGADLFGSILCSVQNYKPQAHQPYVLSTIFGSVIMGPLPVTSDNQQRPKPLMTFFTHMELDSTPKRFWEIEEPIGQLSSNSIDDEICEQPFLKTHYRTSSGRYVVSLPFKSKPSLGPSRGQALHRLVNLERKLLRSPSVKDAHKLKVVSDGSATTSTGSLNDRFGRASSRHNAATIKAYLCVYLCVNILFMCMSTKAIHLEVVSDLSTPAFLASFDRFVSRRGLPSNVHSDCGKHFVRAAHKLKEVADWHHDRDTQDRIINHVTPRNIDWSFNPPHSPHFGGRWEASVKMTKSLLYRTVGTASFTIEELSTIFTKIEAVINSRPISPMSSDPTDLQPLTPGHFLVGGPLTALPEPNLLDIHQYRLSKGQRLNHITKIFWQRWSTEYLHTLQTRKKWTSSSAHMEVPDLVIIKERTWHLFSGLPADSYRYIQEKTVLYACQTFKLRMANICVL